MTKKPRMLHNYLQLYFGFIQIRSLDKRPLHEFCTNKKYNGIPMVIFTGKVTAKAIGKKSPGFAFGTDIFIAAGTAM